MKRRKLSLIKISMGIEDMPSGGPIPKWVGRFAK
jgi:hypothetical protein